MTLCIVQHDLESDVIEARVSIFSMVFYQDQFGLLTYPLKSVQKARTGLSVTSPKYKRNGTQPARVSRWGTLRQKPKPKLDNLTRD